MTARRQLLRGCLLAPVVACLASACFAVDYPIVDTGQERCYDARREIRYPKPGEPFFGQDAQYRGNPPAYRDNGDGKVSRQEFDGPADHFDHLDRNGDGYLSEDEAPPRPPIGARPGEFQRRPDGPAQGPRN